MKKDSSFVITPEEVLEIISREKIKELLDNIHSSDLLERVHRYVIRHLDDTCEGCAEASESMRDSSITDSYRSFIASIVYRTEDEPLLRAIYYLIHRRIYHGK